MEHVMMERVPDDMSMDDRMKRFYRSFKGDVPRVGEIIELRPTCRRMRVVEVVWQILEHTVGPSFAHVIVEPEKST
jgi:hypothetical protein